MSLPLSWEDGSNSCGKLLVAFRSRAHDPTIKRISNPDTPWDYHICLHWGGLGVNVGIYGIHGVCGKRNDLLKLVERIQRRHPNSQSCWSTLAARASSGVEAAAKCAKRALLGE